MFFVGCGQQYRETTMEVGPRRRIQLSRSDGTPMWTMGIGAENNHPKEPSYDIARSLEALAPDRQPPAAALQRTRDHRIAALIRLVAAYLWRRADSHVPGVSLGIPGAGALAHLCWAVLVVRLYRCAHYRCARRHKRRPDPDRLECEDLDSRTGRRRVYWLGHPHCQKADVKPSRRF